MRKYKCKYDIEFQDLKEIMDFVADKYGKNVGFIYKSADRKTKTVFLWSLASESISVKIRGRSFSSLTHILSILSTRAIL